MPKFYHVQLVENKKQYKNDTINIIDNLSQELHKGLFYSKKNVFFNNIYKTIGLSENENYFGYIEYEVIIPSTLFTKSLCPRTPKIIKIDKTNKKEFSSLVRKNKEYIIYENENVLGIDITDLKIAGFNYEGMIYKNHPDIFIKKTEERKKLL